MSKCSELAEMILGVIEDVRDGTEDVMDRKTMVAQAIEAAIDEQIYDLQHRMNCCQDDLEKVQEKVEALKKRLDKADKRMA